MLMAVMLLTMAGLAAAAPPVVNWGFTSGSNVSTAISGTVYDSTPSHVYASVYATIYGGYSYTTSIVAADIYSAQSFTIPLANYLTSGQTYPAGAVALRVYSSVYSDMRSPTITPYPSPAFTFIYNNSSTGGGGGGGGGGGSTSDSSATSDSSTSSTASLPSVSATLGAPVTVNGTTGASVKAEGVTIAIPAGALEGNVKVTITQITNLAGLTPEKGSALVSQVLELTKSVTGNFSKPITLTIDFDSSKVDTSKVDVKICFFDETKKVWTPLDNITVADGKVSGDVNHFTKFAVLTFPKEAAAVKPAGLNDISGHWAEANIKKLVEAGAVAGYSDGSFKPNNNITRAEFATILVKALKLQAAGGKVFADTANHWAKDSISAAAAAGIVNGYSATQFGPNDLITRQQMAVMIAKAAKLAKADGKTFSDNAAIAAWAKDAAASVSAAGIMSGYPDGSFKPAANATRAEAVTVVVKAMK